MLRAAPSRIAVKLSQPGFQNMCYFEECFFYVYVFFMYCIVSCVFIYEIRRIVVPSAEYLDDLVEVERKRYCCTVSSLCYEGCYNLKRRGWSN